MTADFARKPVLTGTAVQLRPFRPEDLPHITAALDDPEVLRLTGSAHRPPIGADALARWYATRNEQTDRLDLAVVDLASGRCVGEVVLNEWDEPNLSCSFRTLIGPAGRGRGLGTEALRLLLGHAFDELGLHRVQLEVYSFNPRARRVYEKVGFVAEGVLREALRDGDGWADATVMAVLAGDWARHRGRPGTAATAI
ncbi:GNAT family N-acetyltransferase [Kitasatospora sp. DSM 101779]|uniref:GNAT family N-acetyltransferase n=1 Tax=Kitasatospora sp. DSM 101779 TaxID=2853165 RepID=UPI0021DA8A01|nr:GNAT family protein [Kitasatospora sp. DSM 101779]MCU7827385.1 GNAT family N-acetyltransferase [Kitasatospora sp. DSM 101779]